MTERPHLTLPLRTGQIVLGIGALLWTAAVILLGEVDQLVTYTVCSHSLISFPPPSLHWPPEGRNLQLITYQHDTALTAAAATIIGTFLLLYSRPDMGTVSRTGALLGAVAASLTMVGLLWLGVEHHLLSAELDALARCL